MPAGRAAPSFLDALRASGLLTPEQLGELAKRPEARDPAPTPLARAVLQRGWLTRFQLTTIAAGRAKDLTVGPYVVLDHLGEGGMGQVFKARHQHMQRVVALKVIRKEKLANADSVKRFYQEVQAAAALHHPNIVLAYDAGQAGSAHYFAMEHVEGIDLAKLVKEKGKLPVPRACEYVRQAALGLQHAHERGLVHRDVKPSNLLVGRAPAGSPIATSPAAAAGAARGNDVVKLLDMGLARLQGAGETNVTKAGAVIGTPDYLAPEQAINSRAADIRSDLYSLGCTLFYLLTGRPPFTGSMLTEVLLKHQRDKPLTLANMGVEAPDGVQAILDALMAKKPEARFQTPAELVEAIAPFCREGELEFDVLPLGGAGRAEDSPWGSLDGADDRKPKPKAPERERTEELSRTSAGARQVRKKRQESEEEAGRKKKGLLLAGAAGAGGVALLGALALVLYLAFGRGEPDRRAQGPRATEPAAKGANGATDKGGDPVKPPDKGGDPVKPPDKGGDPIKPPDKGGDPVKPPPPPVQLAGNSRELGVPKDDLGAVALSPDGKRIFAAGKRLVLWDVAANKELHDFKGKQIRWPQAAAWSSDGHKVVVGGAQGMAYLFDADTGREVASFPGHKGGIAALAFSPDGRHVATGAGEVRRQADGKFVYDGNDVVCWDAATGKEEHRFRGHTRPIQRVAFSADGKNLYSASNDDDDRTLRVWDVEKGVPLRTLTLGLTGTGMAFSADGREFAYYSRADMRVHIVDVEKVQEARQSEPLSSPVGTLSWSADGKYLALGMLSINQLKPAALLFDTATLREVKRAEWDGHASFALAGPGGAFLLAAPAGALRRWDAAPGAAPPPAEGGRPLPIAQNEAVTVALFSPDGKRVFTGGRKLRLWDVAGNKPLRDFNGKAPGFATAAAWFPSGKAVLVGGTRGEVTLFEADTGRELMSFARHTSRIAALAVSPDGRYVAAAGGQLVTQDGKVVNGPDGKFVYEDVDVIRWEVDTGKAVSRYRGHKQSIQAVAFSADGKRLYSASVGDACVNVWDVGKEAPVRTIPVNGLTYMAFSPDGREFAFITNQHTIRAYDLEKGKVLRSSPPFEPAPVRICWSGDGKYLGLGGATRKGETSFVSVVDAATCAEVKRVEGLAKGLTVMDLSHDGKLLLAGWFNGGVRVWDAVTKAPVKPDPVKPDPVAEKGAFVGHDGAVLCVAFAPDGRLFSGGKDGTVRTWEAETGKSIKVMWKRKDEIRCLAIAPDGKSGASGFGNGEHAVWNAANGQFKHSMGSATDRGSRSIEAVAFSPDSASFLVAATKFPIATVAGTEPGRQGQNPDTGWRGACSAAFAPDGTVFALGGPDGQIGLWDADKPKGRPAVLLPPVHKGEVTGLCFLPGKAVRLLSAGEDGLLVLWDVKGRKAAGQHTDHKGKIYALALSPDGKKVATAGHDGTVRVWELGTYKLLNSFKDHKAEVYGVAFSPDGKYVASCGADGIKLSELQKAPAKP